MELVTSSRLVCLAYDQMHNSAAALAALSLDRAVLVPANDVTRSLADEVGEDWVRLLEGPLTAQALQEALSAAPTTGHPDLQQRSWAEVGEQHAAVYRAAMLHSRGRAAARG